MLNKTLLYIFILYTLSFSTVFSETDSKTEPLELQKIMKAMGNDMQNILVAINKEDWSAIKQSAVNIAEHPKPPFTEKIRILSFIGTDTAQFKKLDTITHNTAMELVKLAEQENGNAIIDKFAQLQKSCLNCHQSFRKPFQAHFYGK